MLKITIVTDRGTLAVAVSAGKLTRQSLSANPFAATALVSHLNDDCQSAMPWWRHRSNAQLEYPFYDLPAGW